MIQVTPVISIDERELEFRFIRSSGPGGQNVNKVSSAVQLRFDAARSPGLPEAVRDRLGRLAGRRMTAEGLLIIEARRFRTQERNRQDAVSRLVELLRAAGQGRKRRRPTRPSRSAEERRLEHKRQRSQVKRRRGAPESDSL